MSFLSPESRLALENRFGKIVSNIPKLAVDSLAERLRVSAFQGVPGVWDDFLRLDLDQLAPVLHREALTLGQSFCVVWADSAGNPTVTVESAEQVAVMRDPVTRRVVAAVKRVRTDHSTEAWLYQADTITHFRANSPTAVTSAFEIVEQIANPLAVVPVVPFTNSDRLADEDGVSEISASVQSLCDGLNKALGDALVAMEFAAKPRRYAIGVGLAETPVLDADGNPVLDEFGNPVMEAGSPIPDTDRMIVLEEADAKIGQLPGADLAGFRTIIETFTAQLQAATSMPSHYLGVLTAQPASADALRASEAALTAKAETKQLALGRSWEQVARLIYAVRNSVDPDSVTARVVWADASTRSIGQEADAALKLYQSRLLSRTGVLKRLGYADDEIKAELEQIIRESSQETEADPFFKLYGNQFQV